MILPPFVPANGGAKLAGSRFRYGSNKIAFLFRQTPPLQFFISSS